MCWTLLHANFWSLIRKKTILMWLIPSIQGQREALSHMKCLLNGWSQEWAEQTNEHRVSLLCVALCIATQPGSSFNMASPWVSHAYVTLMPFSAMKPIMSLSTGSMAGMLSWPPCYHIRCSWCNISTPGIWSFSQLPLWPLWAEPLLWLTMFTW